MRFLLRQVKRSLLLPVLFIGCLLAAIPFMFVYIRAADDNPNVNVWMLWTGNHCGFRWYDRNWFENVTRDYFTYRATWE